MTATVFVHGIRLSHTMWNPVAALVGGRTAAPDLPGHGERRAEPFTVDGAVNAIVTAIDAVGGRAVLVGHSLGGYLAIATAGRHPDRVAALVAGGCTVQPQGLFLATFRLVARLAAGRPELADRLSARGFRRALPGPVADAMTAGGVRCAVMPEVVSELAALDAVAHLRRYPGPALLFNGARDPFRTEERRFLLAAADGRLVTVPRRGHIGVMAETATLAGLVRAQIAAA
ncbi:alpha/beta fold hydrolase [Actinoplanes regularis]|uniref:Alpha/beta hydrolase family protein n=1 Tax=Actinoplanes regularis TaxID=52697 RepID=A0A239G174_9ACTN|nr:alpha/beta fold hydrolase [Actinoplanes regularis]GIE90064.1 lysophospholipase [Actinoplanes regularis]SNS62223.1 Alpha/beta hydrolase family protein [Actinoplanes regularis]